MIMKYVLHLRSILQLIKIQKALIEICISLHLTDLMFQVLQEL